MDGYALQVTNPTSRQTGLVGFNGRVIWFETRLQAKHGAPWMIRKFRLWDRRSLLPKPRLVAYTPKPTDLYFGHFTQGVDQHGNPLGSDLPTAARA